MSRCAGCLVPFNDRERKIVADTEVFHERCLELIPRSLTNKLKQKVITLSARNKTIENAQQEANLLRVGVDAANADARKLRADNDRLTRDLRGLRAAAMTAARSGEYFQERVQRLELDKEQLMLRAQNAERELALLHTLSGARQDAITVPGGGSGSTSTSTPKNDGKDDTEIRFSLLELDDKK